MVAKKVEVVSDSESWNESESEIDSIDLLMESYVNLEKKFEIIAKNVQQQTRMLEELIHKLLEKS